MSSVRIAEAHQTQNAFSSSQLPEPTRSPAQPSPSRLPTLSKPRPVSEHNGRLIERRSLLPQIGSPKAIAATAQPAKGDASAAPIAKEPTARTRALSRTQSVTSKLQAAAKKPEDAAKLAMPPPPAPSAISRAQSLRKPATPATSQTRTTRATSLRAPQKSSTTSAVPRTTSTTQSSTNAPTRSNRPGSAASNASSQTTIHRTSQTERSRAATLTSAPSSRMPPPSTDVKRTGSMIKHSRSRSDLSAVRNPAAATTTRRAAEPQEKEPKLVARPAFSTLQQHYSPKKTLEPKKPTSSFFNASSANIPPADALSAETMALQAELLQLHLLCESSSEVQTKWERSAERALRLQFYEVATAHHNMRKNESEVQELVNLHALQEWSSGNAAFGLAENIQLLGPLLNDLRALTDSGGRYTQVVQGFEHWLDRVEEVWAARDASQNFDVAEGLGETWKAEIAALLRKVTVLERDVDRLLEPAEGSSIRVIFNGCRKLVKGMLSELQMMRRIELEVGEGEALWVEQGLEGIARKMDTRVLEAHGEEASWRVV